jgi:hypothetical protein
MATLRAMQVSKRLLAGRMTFAMTLGPATFEIVRLFFPTDDEGAIAARAVVRVTMPLGDSGEAGLEVEVPLPKDADSAIREIHEIALREAKGCNHGCGG